MRILSPIVISPPNPLLLNAYSLLALRLVTCSKQE